MNTRWCISWLYCLAVLMTLFLWESATSIASPPLSTTNKSDTAQLVPHLQGKLAEAQAELNSFMTAQAESTNLFPGVTPAEQIEYQLVLQSLVRAYERQLDDLAELDSLNQRQLDLAETIRSWNGFAEPPPYSILLVDSLRDSVHSLTTSISTAQATRDILEKLKAEAQNTLAQSESGLRALREELETTTDPARTAYLSWQQTFELARNRLAAANTAGFERRRQKIAAEIGEHRQRLGFVRRQLLLATQQVRFSPADLGTVLAGLETNRFQLEAEYKAAKIANQTAQQALAAARQDLRKTLSPPPEPQATNELDRTTRIASLQQLVAVRTIQAETANLRLNVSRQLIDLVLYERAMWRTRFSTFAATDPLVLQRGYRRLLNMQRFLQTAKPSLTYQIDLAARLISEEQENLLNPMKARGDPEFAHERLDSFKAREALFQGALADVEKTERLLLRWKESLDHDRSALPLAGRVRDLFTELTSFGAKFWNFELLVAEDTIVVDGQPVTGRRSVTIGKVVKAIVIFAVGCWVANLFARVLEAIAVRRLKIERNQANLVRRWTRVVLVLLLIGLSLVWVKIPFTVFAFLGGALAIGLGFGMQNLLKNFISGIIILFERPFRVGDVLDVAGQCGTVTSIGIRSSILQAGDGTEILIPNSTLLENSFTNWTYTTRTVRSSIEIVVASNSDTRRVAQLLAESAARHGLVLKEPQPEVLFEGFKDNGFGFQLRYWLDVQKHNTAQVSSDLRHMIATAFAEHAITISFPQRDLHFDPKYPLRLQVVSTPEDHVGSGRIPP